MGIRKGEDLRCAFTVERESRAECQECGVKCSAEWGSSDERDVRLVWEGGVPESFTLLFTQRSQAGVSKGVEPGSQVVKTLPVANAVNDWCHAGSSRSKIDSVEGSRQNKCTQGVI